jgi:hypothetical protein
MPITHKSFVARHQGLDGSGKYSLPMGLCYCGAAIGKPFGVTDATPGYEILDRNRY